VGVLGVKGLKVFFLYCTNLYTPIILCDCVFFSSVFRVFTSFHKFSHYIICVNFISLLIK